jgi:hypothetical protein
MALFLWNAKVVRPSLLHSRAPSLRPGPIAHASNTTMLTEGEAHVNQVISFRLTQRSHRSLRSCTACTHYVGPLPHGRPTIKLATVMTIVFQFNLFNFEFYLSAVQVASATGTVRHSHPRLGSSSSAYVRPTKNLCSFNISLTISFAGSSVYPFSRSTTVLTHCFTSPPALCPTYRPPSTLLLKSPCSPPSHILLV